MTDNSQVISETLYALSKIGEHQIWQFRKIMLLCPNNELDQLQLDISSKFKNAEISTVQKDADKLNAAKPLRACFDLIVIVDMKFGQLDVLLQKFKCRYIVLINSGIEIYVRARDRFRRIETSQTTVIYCNRQKFYDVFMPIGPADYVIAQDSINNKHDFLPGLREIFYCAEQPLDCDAVYVSEKKYPFEAIGLEKIRNFGEARLGWYYQQLKQLYFWSAEKTSLDFYLSICTDVFFNRKFDLFDADGNPIYTYSASPTHQPYIDHMASLHPQLRSFDGRSAVSHHAIFARYILMQLFHEVFLNSGLSFWEAFIKNISEENFLGAGAAEYEIYFNYLRLIGEKFSVREPDYLDTGDHAIGRAHGGSYYAYHHYMRNN
jgi:hypothetical protein